MSSNRPDRRELLDRLAAAVRANQRATDIVDELVCRLLGINRTDARCIDILDERSPLSAGELAASSGLTTGAITAVLDRLERAGYARRVADPADRRRVLVELTPKAREASLELFGPLAEAWAPLDVRFSDDELTLMIEFQLLGREIQERHAEWLRQRAGDSESGT